MNNQKVIITFAEPKPNHDHVIVFGNNNFIGFRGLKSKKICVQRCPICRKENYISCVSRGICAWCGWNVNKDEIEIKGN